MEITSFYFLCFFALTLMIYYLVPGKIRWGVLLGASFAYYLFCGNPVLILYPLTAVLVTWAATMLLPGAVRTKAQDEGAETKRNPEKDKTRKRLALTLELVVLLGILFVLKYANFMGEGTIAVPMGLSFYTFILVGYFLDCYNGICQIQTNPLKVCVYGMYFPLMTSGPILSLRSDGDQFFVPHKLSYENLTYGAQRVLWGFFKELVISQRLSLAAAEVFGSDTTYSGLYIWLGILCFTFQLYTNFSGCMDIVNGISEMFGLKMPENFDTPFFARNISEYWRRWHATLGVWMKEHVFYPLLRTRFFIEQGKYLRKKIGKKKGKQVNTFLAMFLLWLSVGLWHGGALKYVIGSGLLHWFYIVTGELTLPFFTWLFAGKMHMNLESKAADVFRIFRTFFLVNIGNLFFRADSTPHALSMLAKGLHIFAPDQLPEGASPLLGLSWIDWAIVLVSLGFVLVTSLLQYRYAQAAAAAGETYDYHGIRKKVASWKMPLRWIFWMAFLFYVILLGQYGPDFSAAEFIYAGF